MSTPFSFSSKDRLDFFAKSDVEFDILIIGGGITGAGIALDASARGLSVALVEKHDFAWGTSSRSTKLIHGGLRYLKQLELGLVKEVGRERSIPQPRLFEETQSLSIETGCGQFVSAESSRRRRLVDRLSHRAHRDR